MTITIRKLHLALAVLALALIAPATAVATHVFTDVPDTAFYAEPVEWAFDNDITTGKSATIFDPLGQVTRGESVTFLSRYDVNVVQPALAELTADVATLAEDVKSMSISPFDFFVESGGYLRTTGSTQHTGAVLPDGLFASATFGAVLPTDLTPGSQLRIEVFWHINESGCTVEMRNNTLQSTRLGEAIISTSTVLLPYIKLGGLDTSEVRRYTLVTTRDDGYRPGDIIKLGMWRSTTNDTCTDEVYIDGARVLYD